MSHSILVFDYSGFLISQFGKQGRGPEEFVRINSFGIGPNNEIVTYDSSLDLIRTFNIEGELLETRSGLLQFGLWNRGNQISVAEEKIVFSIEESAFSSPDNFWLSSTFAWFGSDNEKALLKGKHDPISMNSDYLYKYALHGVDYESNRIYTVHRTGFYVQEFDLISGSLLHRFGLIPQNFKIWVDEAKERDGLLERRLKNVNQSFSSNPIVCKDMIFHPYQNMSLEFYNTEDPFEMEYYYAIYKKSTKEYMGDIFFQDRIPLGLTRECAIVTLVDDNPDDFKIIIEQFTF